MIPPLDPRPLSASIDADARRRVAPAAPPRGYIIALFLLTATALVAAASPHSDLAARLIATGLFVVPLAAVGLAAAAASRARTERHIRLLLLAEANGLTYHPHAADPGHSGLVFTLGTDRRLTHATTGIRGHEVEVADLRITRPRGSVPREDRLSYGSLCLGTALPHLLLLRADDPLTTARHPQLPDAARRLSLEGDFDQYFSLFCPEGYERDALLLLTPDVMAMLIDQAAGLSLEIIDDRVIVWTSGSSLDADPSLWMRLMSVLDLLRDRADTWERWRDDRLPVVTASSESLPLPIAAAGVASAGRRQRLRASRTSSWIAGGIVLFVLVGLILELWR